MRGGQITVFVLVGLAILIVILLLIALRNLLAPDVTPGLDSYDKALVQGYVESCMDLVAQEGFRTLGFQGGLLFTEQGGLHEHSSLEATVYVAAAAGDALPERRTISLGLANRTQNPFRPPRYDPPSYPFPSRSIQAAIDAQDAYSNPRSDGSFGQYALPLLCDRTGPNTMAPTNPGLRCAAPLFPLPVPVHGPSIQESLGAYITNGLETCLDAELLGDLLGASVDAERGSTRVILTEASTVVELTLPLTFSGADGALRSNTFTKEYPVRLYAVYRYLYSLLKAASKDPELRVADPASYTATPFYDGFTVTQETLDGRHLLTLHDPLSRVDRATWTWNVLLDNRPPILDYYEDVRTGSSVRALDPDGDELAFTLDGQPLTTTNARYAAAVIPPSADGTHTLTITDSLGARDWQPVNIVP